MQMVQKMLATRGGTVTLGAFAAGFAALLLVVYLNQYQNSVSESGEPMTVLVAKSLIEKGTPGDVVGVKELFQTAEVEKRQVKEGAISDPSALRGREATVDIYPGQPLTAGDFAGSTEGALGSQLVASQRAMSVPVDAAHGMVGQVRKGDRVDVLGAFEIESAGAASRNRVVKVLSQNVLVLEAPARDARGVATGTVNVVLRTTYRQAGNIAWTAENGKVWIVLRPRTGAPIRRASIVTEETVLRSRGGH